MTFTSMPRGNPFHRAQRIARPTFTTDTCRKVGHSIRCRIMLSWVSFLTLHNHKYITTKQLLDNIRGRPEWIYDYFNTRVDSCSVAFIQLRQQFLHVLTATCTYSLINNSKNHNIGYIAHHHLTLSSNKHCRRQRMAKTKEDLEKTLGNSRFQTQLEEDGDSRTDYRLDRETWSITYVPPGPTRHQPAK